MLSEALYRQIFKEEAKVASGIKSSLNSAERLANTAGRDTKHAEVEDENFEAVEEHLSDHNLWGREATILEDLNFELPKLFGKNIDEHFRHLGKKQTEDYVKLAERIVKTDLPDKPKRWEYAAGWTKYGTEGEVTPVEFPEEEVYVFDIESLVQEGNYPTMATAVSDKHW